ncbi:hypothetical protein HF086_006653 [Spodoptera exigua]|uniref:Arrestin C-terminal-like domain-containing protein n=1 Tax=Spodoptera exigua TaxID=7107 RepID=A0A922MF24_SPOEX|nr:hypothetical protein HF086_006653 [Spodoptera exigua]
MGVMCQILINRTEDGVFKVGGLVTGTLKYFIDKPTHYKSISITFLGKGSCWWSESRGKTTTHYSNSEEYINQIVNIYLDREKEDFISGGFEYPFQFLLPVDIPPSFKDSTCTIEYKIIVTFAKANKITSKKYFDVEIPVTSYVNPCSLEPMMFCLRKNIFSFNKTNSNQIDLKGEIIKTCVTPGENIQIRLTVNNDTNLQIFAKTELVHRLTYIASCGHKKTRENIVSNTSTMTPVAANSVVNLICVIPTLHNLSSLEHTKVMIGEYKVKLVVKPPFPHMFRMLYIPVAIGLRKHELVVPGAVYYQYDGEQPSCSSVAPRNDIFAGEDEKKYFEKYEKVGIEKNEKEDSDEEDGIDFDINDKLKFEKLDINEFEDSREEKNSDKDSRNKEAQSR